MPEDAAADPDATSAARPKSPSFQAWMLLTVVALAFYGAFLRDHIPVSDGFGYDGRTYGRVALEPEFMLSLPLNRVQRCLPSLVVHGLIRGLGLARTPVTVFSLFLLLNTALILAGLHLWLKIVSLRKLRTPAAIFGFCGLFLSFSSATMPYYYPVLTDTVAFFLGLLVTWFYLRRSLRGLLLIFLVSGFAWPSLMLFMLPLILFPYEPGRRLRRAPPSPGRSRLALVVALSCVGVTGWVLSQGQWTNPIDSVLPLSLVIMGVYVFVGGRALLDAAVSLWAERTETSMSPILARAAAAASIVLVHWIVLASLFTKPTEPGQELGRLCALVLESSVMAPGAFLVGHLANFGLLFLAVVALWPRICRTAAGFGLGALLFLGLTFAFSLNAESRHATALWPMVVTLVTLVLDRYRWPRSLLAAFCGLTFVNSRSWLLMNGNFPELFFAHFSLNMGTFWYVVQAASFVMVAAYLQLTWRLAGVHPERAVRGAARTSGGALEGRTGPRPRP